jgi:hypothetical protein
MEILSSLLLVITAIVLILYFLLTEGLDWIGRAEIIEKRWPILWGAMNDRPMRLVLLIVAIVMLAHVIGELRMGAVAPIATFAAPKVPEINPNVRVITIGSPPAPHRCWLSNHFGLANSKIPGAVTATAAIIHCNSKVNAPLRVTVEFDRDFIPGAMVFPDAGIVLAGGQGKQDRVFIGQIGSPPLLSDQLVVVTVYGTTDQYPHALRANVTALK